MNNNNINNENNELYIDEGFTNSIPNRNGYQPDAVNSNNNMESQFYDNQNQHNVGYDNYQQNNYHNLNNQYGNDVVQENVYNAGYQPEYNNQNMQYQNDENYMGNENFLNQQNNMYPNNNYNIQPEYYQNDISQNYGEYNQNNGQQIPQNYNQEIQSNETVQFNLESFREKQENTVLFDMNVSQDSVNNYNDVNMYDDVNNYNEVNMNQNYNQNQSQNFYSRNNDDSNWSKTDLFVGQMDNPYPKKESLSKTNMFIDELDSVNEYSHKKYESNNKKPENSKKSFNPFDPRNFERGNSNYQSNESETNNTTSELGYTDYVDDTGIRDGNRKPLMPEYSSKKLHQAAKKRQDEIRKTRLQEQYTQQQEKIKDEPKPAKLTKKKKGSKSKTVFKIILFLIIITIIQKILETLNREGIFEMIGSLIENF